MKKVTCLLCALLVVTSVVSACGGKKNETQAESIAPKTTASAPAPENSDTPASSVPEEHSQGSKNPSVPNKPVVSENKEIVIDSNAPKVFVVSDMADLSYHLEGCSTLSGKDINELPWEVVKTIGLWQCATCNPPRYEDYKNAQ